MAKTVVNRILEHDYKKMNQRKQKAGWLLEWKNIKIKNDCINGLNFVEIDFVVKL